MQDTPPFYIIKYPVGGKNPLFSKKTKDLTLYLLVKNHKKGINPL